MAKRPFSGTARGRPFLEHYPEPGGELQRLPLESLPFRLGRHRSSHFVVPSNQVSKAHSEIVQDGLEYRIRDLGSTNGTYLNGERIDDAVLTAGDIIHVASKEFRFGLEQDDHIDSMLFSTKPTKTPSPRSLIRDRELLEEMLQRKWVRVVFQPIVHLETKEVLGFEALGRGTHGGLSSKPIDLFNLADQCNRAEDLSHLFRLAAVDHPPPLPEALLFLNVHPAELENGRLGDSLKELCAACGKGQRLVLEVHEEAVTNQRTLVCLRNHLARLNIGLAFDDFGIGQARLGELTEIKPDFIKFDRSLIRDIHRDPSRQELVRALTTVITNLGGQTIAEGIEKLADAQTCKALGCSHGQGYFFGRPQPLVVMDQKPRNEMLQMLPHIPDASGHSRKPFSDCN